MSQSLPLPANVKINTILQKIYNTAEPEAPITNDYGYLYKVSVDNSLWWRTIDGIFNLSSPSTSGLASFGSATSLFGGTITVTAPSNTKAGTSALNAAGNGVYTGGSTAFGASALSLLPDNADQGIFTAYGYQAGKNLQAGFASMFFGYQAGALLDASNYDLVIGYQSMSQTTNSGGSNIAIGAKTIYSNSFSGSLNVCIGNEALHDLTTGEQNIVLGYESGYSLTTGSNNVLLGHNCGFNILDGTDNVVIGKNALATFSTGSENVCIGTDAMPLATSSGNTCVGNATGNALTTGQYNTMIGNFNGYAVTTGNFNTIIGQSATAGAAHDYCIVLGGDATATATNQIRLGFDATGTTRQTTCFIDAIRGKTTGLNDAVAVLVDSKGQLGTVSSSIRYKENIATLDDNIVDNVFKLRPTTFNYKTDINSKTFGMIAEEVEEILPQIVVHTTIDGKKVPETIQYHLLVPLLVGAVKKLKQRCDDLEQLLNAKNVV